MIAVAKKKRTLAKRALAAKATTRDTVSLVSRVVQPAPGTQTGCLFCPLLPYSDDFASFAKLYKRDAAKITAKESEPHHVHVRCVQEQRWTTDLDVLFVGEAPGRQENREGIPFTGAAGKILRRAIEACSHLSVQKCGITNVVRCQPPRNRNPNRTEINSCTPQLVREVRKRKPKLLVALGNVALEYLTGQTGITVLNGCVLDCVVPQLKGYKVVACLHPAYVLRADHEMERFIEAIEVVQAFIAGTLPQERGVGEYTTVTTLIEARRLFKRLTNSSKPVAVDTETGGLSPLQTSFPRLLCLSVSDEEGRAWVIPYDHADSPWRVGGTKQHERPALRKLVRRFLRSKTLKILQNGKYDDKHLRVAFGCPLRRYIDTMLMHVLLDERRGTHGLDTLSFRFTGMGGFHKPLDDYIKRTKAANPKRGGSYANIPGEILFPYAGADADATLRVSNKLTNDSDWSTRIDRLSSFLHRLSVVLTDIEENGAKIDQAVAKELDVHYAALMARAEEKIHKLATVRKFTQDRARKQVEKGKRKTSTKSPKFNPASTAQLQEILFGYYGEKPTELTDKGFSVLTIRYERVAKQWREKRVGPAPTFTSVIQDAVKKQQWVHFSTKADVLQDLARTGNELAPLLLEHRQAATLWESFAKPLTSHIDLDGRVHGTFSITGTVTGRLAAYDPNLQNIPTTAGGGRIKSAWVSRFGEHGLIGQVDYSQIELRIAASWFNEPSMIEAYVEAKDLHDLTVLQITGMSAEDFEQLKIDDPAEAKRIRTRAKTTNFAVLYGGGANALQAQLKKAGIFMEFEEAQALIDRYFESRPALRRGIDALHEEVCRTGYLEGFTGRRRRVPEVFSDSREIVARALRQAGNFPIQNGASEMTLMSLVLIHEEMKRRGYKSVIIATVHDSIVFDLHVDEALEVLSLARNIMERLPKLSDQVLKGVDWSWLRVPIVAECELGHNWQALVGVDPDDYDIDDLWSAMEEKVIKCAA